jgi:aromatic ring-opening dioxygenase catalytic subunit (LigB family)
MTKLPVLFLSHGGGPWPWVPEMRKAFKKTEDELKSLGKKLKPRAILSVTGHWEEEEFTVGGSANPPMVYDYHGFPPHTYEIVYPAPGDPSLGERVRELLMKAGKKVKIDSERGFDHGTFVPLSLMYPNADVPIVQLSIKSTLDPRDHLDLGKALGPLRAEGVLIVCSGLTYHNLRAFFRGGGETSKVFGSWLSEVIKKEPRLRNDSLLHWEQGPSARLAHPREDHLIPLMVAAGAAGEEEGRVLFDDEAFDVMMSSYVFGQMPDL